MNEINTRKIPRHRINLSFKIFTFLLTAIILFSLLVIFFSLENVRILTESVRSNNQLSINVSVQEATDALNAQAEEYLKEVAKRTADAIGDYLKKTKADILLLTKMEKTPQLLLSFSTDRKAEIHRRSDQAPVEGISFPNERDMDDAEEIPVFRTLAYVDGNGMEKVKIENNEISSDLKNVADADYFKETKNLGEGEIYVLRKKYVIWDCTERHSTVMGESLYKNEGGCPHTGIVALNATGWKRFTDGYIRYAMPVYENNTFKGMIVADVDFLPIMKIVNDVKTGKTGYAYLQQSIMGTEEYDRGEGMTVAHPSHQFVLNMDPTSLYKLGAPGLDDLRILSQRQQKGEFGIGRYIFREVDKYTSYASYNESGIIWSVGITSPVEEFTSPAKNVQEKIGEVIANANKEMEQITGNSLLSLLAWVIILLFILLGILIFFMNRIVIYPLRKLRIAAAKIGKGDLDTKIELKSKDEIGELASAFSQMTLDLKQSQEQIKRHAQELEQNVRERTSELGTKVNELTGTKTAVLNMMEDMDEANKQLVQTQEELKESLKELKEMDIKKDQFISIAAHELKTPLTSIHGFSQLLQNKEIAKEPAKRDKYLKIMDHETKRLAKLVTDILDLSRIDLGTVKLNSEEVDVSKLMEDIKREMGVQIKAKKLSSEYDIEKGMPNIVTDREKLTEIIINLINNSVKYTPKGKITVKVFREKENVHFIVKDTGIGISRENHEKIFERFYQVDSSFTRKAGGTGLGLALCSEFLDMLGGKIWVKSEEGSGSEFHFTLPVKGAPKKYVREGERKARETLKKSEETKEKLKRSGLGEMGL